jgi:hypothetical protein
MGFKNTKGKPFVLCGKEIWSGGYVGSVFYIGLNFAFLFIV